MNINYKNLISAVAFSSALFVSTGCKKTFPPLPDKVEDTTLTNHNRGCNDINSPYYNSNDKGNGDCKYAYVTSYEITYYPDDSWDYFSDADLILNITALSSDVKVLQGAEKGNHNPTTPAIWDEAREIKLDNKVYHWQLDDYDAADPNDLISEGTFNPIEEIKNGQNNGTITMAASGSQLVIHYIIK